MSQSAVEVLERDAPEAGRAVSSVITPSQMIEQALAKNASVEVMERLFDMHAKYDAMQAKKAFNNAMADLRQTMPEIVKGQSVDFTTGKGRTNYKYEDLSAVTKALSPVMAAVGLSFRWRTESAQNGVAVTCIITHRDGHSEETTLSAPFDASGNKNPIQAIGSATTYLQRYTLKAAVGVAAAQDDDGQSAGRRPDEPATQRQEQPPAKSKADSRDSYSRLSKANRDIKTLEAFNKFWMTDSVRAAANSLPHDWKNNLVAEKAEQLADLEKAAATAKTDPSEQESGDFPFPGDDGFPGER